MEQLHVVVGGFWGSEGKGHVTAWLTRELEPSIVVRVAGPNAGHTAYDGNGERWSLRQIPVAAVADNDCMLGIAPGSEIDPAVLVDELDRLADLPPFNTMERLVVDPQATVIQPKHRDSETELVGRIGSTGKGIGAARADRIMRTALTWDEWLKTDEPDRYGWEILRELASRPVRDAILDAPGDVIIEGTQGYGLGLHAGYYPHCTSSDCTAVDFIAMAGLSPWEFTSPGGFPQLSIWPVFRTFPIRVAGNSGPLHGELDWADLAERTGGHVQPEKTTVTQKVRRVGTWNADLARRAIVANGGAGRGRSFVYPVLTFLDYLFPRVYAQTMPNSTDWTPEVWATIERFSRDLGVGIRAVGTGPSTIVHL